MDMRKKIDFKYNEVCRMVGSQGISCYTVRYKGNDHGIEAVFLFDPATGPCSHLPTYRISLIKDADFQSGLCVKNLRSYVDEIGFYLDPKDRSFKIVSAIGIRLKMVLVFLVFESWTEPERKLKNAQKLYIPFPGTFFSDIMYIGRHFYYMNETDLMVYGMEREEIISFPHWLRENRCYYFRIIRWDDRFSLVKIKFTEWRIQILVLNNDNKLVEAQNFDLGGTYEFITLKECRDG
ncbi:hypothetical protein AMTR_s00024p00247690 [Amborella trichopoda]|uniref:F-box associated domain-containing protein n=1 Tax=Amborella trichopoda TaxID=13333 RepID=W1PMS6_AMBTC|nr:hypothetical protein AMTR_s00024p00247690 [Amborella trichopoda]